MKEQEFRMQPVLSAFLLATGMSLGSGDASAALIDFDGIGAFTDASIAGNIVPIANSVVTNNFQSDGVLFGEPGVSAGVAVVRNSTAPSWPPNTVSGLDASGIIPGTASGNSVGDIFFSFVIPNTSTSGVTDSLSFTIGDAGFDLDIFQIRSFDIDDNLINSQDVSGISRFGVAVSIPGIQRVEVDFTGDFGYTVDDLNFDTPRGPFPFLKFLKFLNPGRLRWWRPGNGAARVSPAVNSFRNHLEILKR